MNKFQVYHESEIQAFTKVYYRPKAMQSPADHGRMLQHIQPAIDRFKAIEDEQERDDFRQKLKGYVSVYAFLTQILPYADKELEMLHSFGRFLLPYLPVDRGESVKLTDEIALQYYRLEAVESGAISVAEGDAKGVKSPTDVGTGKPKEEKASLSEIISKLNERFGTEFTEEDRLFFEQIKEKAVNDTKFIDTALSNPLDKFELSVKKLIEGLMIQRLGENDDIVTRYMEDGAFQGTAFPILAKEIFDSIHAKAAERNVSEIVEAGEGNTVEFKSTLRVNLHTGKRDPKMEHAVLKTLAAFLNSKSGGTLVVGIDDEGKPLGLEVDAFPDEDKAMLHLGNLIKSRLGAPSMLHLQIHFEDFQETRVLVVDCAPSGAPVFLKQDKSEEFFIRAGASTAALGPSEMSEYIGQRFK